MTIASATLAPPSPLAPALIAEGRALLRLAAPIMLICLVNMGMSITDAVMVSTLFGAEALAAVAVGSDLYSILFYLGAGVLAGFAPLYSAALVRADAAERARLERTGRLVATLVAAVLAPLIWTVPDWLGLLGLDPALLVQGSGYTRAMAATLAPMLGVTLYRTILIAAEKPQVFLKVTIAMLPLNAVADYVLMTGAGHFPAFGPAGSGLGSLVVAVAAFAILMRIGRAPLPRGGGGTDWKLVTRALRVGLPIGVATVAEVGVFLAATLYAAPLGAADVAAHTLALRTAGVAYAVPTALLQAAMVRSARAEALVDSTLRSAARASGLGLGLGAGVLLLAAIAVGARPLAGWFFDASPVGASAASVAVGLLLLLAAMELAGTPGAVAAGLLRGRQVTRAPMAYTLAGHWTVGAPLGVYLCEALSLGVTGLWIGLAAGTWVSAAATVVRESR